MKTLIRFLLKSKTLFLFLFLEIVSLILIVNHNQFQRSWFLNSSNAVVGEIYTFSNSVSEYFNLKTVNENLAKENAELRNLLHVQENELNFIKQDTNYQGRKDFAAEKNFTFITSKVINSSTNKYQNYITLDKGSADSIRPNMGVINALGVVGIVSSASEHFSVVLPILNPSSKISAKIKNGGNAGSLVWKGGDARIALLEEVPLYFPVTKGDTVVTSGNSTIFPEGINIGTVREFRKENYNFYFIEVELFTDFSQLSFVDVISYKNAREQKELEEKEGIHD
ncbi:MAG: rod shape-determining protein MreC [Prevotellaceae bacterium]|jgi:rod shape-determining protein MreC|nr:rod shape-determining protein MreC [Prevotellaceae bacterium]